MALSTRREGGSWGGTMTTAGGLVFFCNDAEAFEAADARPVNRSGISTRGSPLSASPMSYAVKESSMWPSHPAAICLPSHYRKVVFGRAWS